MVATIAAAVALVAVKAGTLPAPLAASPIVVFELVQAKVAPAGVLTKSLIGTAAPAQNTRSTSGVITGVGLTVIDSFPPDLCIHSVWQLQQEHQQLRLLCHLWL